MSSRVGSLDNVKHKPGGGLVKIFDEKYARSASEVRYSRSNGRSNGRTNGRCLSPSLANPSIKSGSNTPNCEKVSPSFSNSSSSNKATKSSNLDTHLDEKLKISNLEEKEVANILENERSKMSSKTQPLSSNVELV